MEVLLMKRAMKMTLFTIAAFLLIGFWVANARPAEAANSYLPHWEHIPDGEPRLFEDPDNPGKYRVYIYGSHDTRKNQYCGYDLVTWSAPVEDLNDWRYEGVIFESIINGEADVLFAPDVVEKEEDGNKVYYLYPNNQASGRSGMIAKSDSPKGPFTVCNWKEGSTTEAEGVLGFDPAVFIDDDGRVYGYWGFQSSNMAELDPDTMCTVKKGCSVLREDSTGIDGSEGDNFRFFEASSIRKVEDKYVFVYSRNTKNGEFGLGVSNCTLAYAYSDSPLGPWTYGGTIVDARAREKDQNGKDICAVQSWGNTHGSILEVNGQWYVFYHRCIDNSMYSRQAMAEPIDVKVTEDGRVEITEAEVTSQGFEINGMNPYKMQTAGSACFLTGGPQIEAHYDETNPGSNVIKIKKDSIVGFKYLNFDAGKGSRDKNLIAVQYLPKGKDGTIDVMLDRPWEEQDGVKIGTIEISAEDDGEGVVKTAQIDTLSEIKGKHALYFVFHAEKSGDLCDLKAFQFGESTVTDADEGQDYVEPEPTASPDPIPSPSTAPAASPSPTAASGSQPTSAPTPAPVQNTPAPALQIGQAFSVGSLTYRVTDADLSGKGTAAVTGTKKKSVKSIVIPDAVSINGIKLQVTAVEKSAFKGCKALTRLTIGKNIARIDNQAFQSCKKLKTIKIKSGKLKKVGKNAFKGIHKNAKISVPKKQLASYKKLFKSGQGIKKSMKIRL